MRKEMRTLGHVDKTLVFLLVVIAGSLLFWRFYGLYLEYARTFYPVDLEGVSKEVHMKVPKDFNRPITMTYEAKDGSILVLSFN
jgi:hypothetical protein